MKKLRTLVKADKVMNTDIHEVLEDGEVIYRLTLGSFGTKEAPDAWRVNWPKDGSVQLSDDAEALDLLASIGVTHFEGLFNGEF